MLTITTQRGKHVTLLSQDELCNHADSGVYLRSYCPIHGSDHTRSLSIHKQTGWGRCFNASCHALVLVEEWNPDVAERLRRGQRQVRCPVPTSHPPAQSPVSRPVKTPPPFPPPQWQQDELALLLSLDGTMRAALAQDRRVQDYLEERGIPRHIAQATGIGSLTPALLDALQQEQRKLLWRWTERILVPLRSPVGRAYIGRSLWGWRRGMDEHEHKAMLDQPGTPRRWIKTNPAVWFGSEPEQLAETLVLVEGPFDRLALLAAGMRAGDVVALVGVAVHAQWLPAQVKAVVLALDADDGGQEATNRLADALRQAGLRVELCLPPRDQWGKDVRRIGACEIPA